MALVKPDLVTIIYTSGTTGVPKGGNALAPQHHQQHYGELRLSLQTGDTALSFLPICHIYERVVIYLYLLNGISVVIPEQTTWRRNGRFGYGNAIFSPQFPVCWKKYTNASTIADSS